MIIGFTGTRQGVTRIQAAKLFSVLRNLSDEEFTILHGGAKGADTVCDGYAYTQTFGNIEVYPCTNERYLYWVEKGDGKIRAVHSVRKPLDRNRIIAHRCDTLIATPETIEEQVRSGTWSTIRYARIYNKPIILIHHDGSTQREDPKATIKFVGE
jgi:predicted Rossmann fold nucleotide-binding protein DprA/Smf involved in DNA uptake